MDSNAESDALTTSAVSTYQDLAVFLQQLHDDYLKNGKDWENQTLSSFLGALSAYVTDASLSSDAPVASWRVFADLLCAATIYE